MTMLDNPTARTAPAARPRPSAKRDSRGAGAPRSVLQAVPGSAVRARFEQMALATFIVVPLAAVAAAIPTLWGHGIGWHDVVLSFVFYAVTGHGITVGYHRYFTHGAFKARRPVRIALAVAGSMAIEGPVTRWVADHRRHHAFSDKEGDPHSPWRYGESIGALCKGLLHAHVGWLFDIEQTNQRRFAPDLLGDRDIRAVNALFVPLALASLAAPALIGGLWSMSWTGALTALFWASLVRVCVLHHTTWSINSICHAVGKRPFRSRDRSGNVWPLALISMGESWHNLHHADPTCARHGVLRGQIDTSAELIRGLEKLGLVYDVRWASPGRIASRRVGVA